MNKPIVSLIAAMAKNRVIGQDMQMPWHLPADLQHFKRVTLGKPVIMGRKTYESIGRPLPGRHNIVITRNADYKIEGCDTANSLDSALALTGDAQEVMIIGGGLLYEQTLPLADKLFLTFIDLEVDGDTQFPDYSQLKLKELQRESHQADEKDRYNYVFVDYSVIK